MAEWERELVVDLGAVRAVARPRHAWRLLGEGWDCDAWLADDSVVWRVPRRQIAIEGLVREAELLPRLAPLLPLPVPVPELVEVPGLPMLLRHALIPGIEWAAARTTHAELGTRLGRFLRALHAPETTERVRPLLRTDPLGRGDVPRRIAVVRRRLEQIEALVDTRPLHAIVDAADGISLTIGTVCHADLHIRHVLLDERGDATGVIDWGDACLCARPVDLAIVTRLDRPGRSRFFESYGPVDDASWRFARMLAVMLGASLLAADPDGVSGAGARVWLGQLASEEASRIDGGS